MEKNKRKEWLKNAIIIFLVVMLILTFCSDTIMNMYLPEVSTEAATAGRIQEMVRGTGNAELNQACQITLKGSRTIKSVNVVVGQEVQAGDVMFVLEAGEDTELETAKNTYLEIQNEYQKKLIGTNYNYDKDTLAIESARKEYEKALKVYNGLDAKNKKLKSLQKKLVKCDKKITSLENEIANYDNEITNLSAKADVDACQADLTAKKRVLVALQNEKADLDADVAALKAQGVTGDELTEKERAARDKAVEVSNAEADVKAAQTALDNAKLNIEKLDAANKGKNNATSALADAKITQTALTTEIETLKATIITKEEAKNAVDEKENAWNSLVTDYEIKKAEDSNTIESDKIDLNSLKQRLIAQQKVVEQLMADSVKSEVTATIAGKVSSINCQAGDVTQADMPLATIASGTDGYTVKISVTKEQAAKVKVGMNGSVENYWYGDIQAVLASITSDLDNPGNSLLTFAVNGEYIAQGDSLTISLGGENKSYDVVVPKSSIYEDNNGKFVLTLDSKSTPLGTRYIATRHDVTILSEDDVHAAISSDLFGYEYVIMTSSEALTSGQQVKLKE